MPALAESALRVQHSRIRELAEIALTMDGVLKLYFGESNIPTPDFIKRAAQKAMQDGYTFYTSNAGMPSTRDALARYYSEIHGVQIDPAQQIVITASGVQALNVSIRCLLDPGDEAIVLTPAWPNGSAIVQMCNATPVQAMRLRRQSRHARGCSCIPRRRILWAGWRLKKSRQSFSGSRAGTDCG
jgi:aspartate/methionine/tyrosine aminotransferase